ncbi:hypothetical protein BG00_03035 [Pseudoalteromonas sp. SCSIO_11900]|uniref:hypothetical protein n=1 Tax=Pseudoalteromonas sp. SCSIO_11900 TaxID=1461766 RepID=UPI000450297E|nr:hypothetical protein [Pseudoalteromonas sp. SCSIO_11900]EWS97367.1 hypothetical protein BG00_03035 [Pseudoalteromonas sp. SCSIO_11900]
MFKRLTVLISTGLPGLIRLLVFLVVETKYNLVDFGHFASDLSLVQLISFFTAISWAALVMTTVTQSEQPERALFKVINTGVVYLLLFSLIPYVLYKLDITKDSLGTICFIAGWMFYQISRHYIITKKEFTRIIIFDSLNLLVFIVVLFLGVTPLIALTFSHLAFVIFNLPKLEHYSFSLVTIEQQLNGLKNGLSTFLLGLGVYSLPVIFGLILGAEYSVLMGLSTSLLIMIQLVPRSISAYFLPTISKTLLSDKAFALKMHQQQVFYTIISTALLSALGVIFVYFVHKLAVFEVLLIDGALSLIFLLLFNIIITVLAFPFSDLLMSHGNFKVNLIGSFIYSLAVTAALILFLIYGNNTLHAALLMVAYSFSGCMRFYYVFYNARKLLFIGKVSY